MWVTDDPLTLASTVISFLMVLVSHCLLLSHLTLRRLPGSPRMSKPMSAASGLVLLLCTSGYYVNYLRSSRYGVSTKEWIIFTAFTAFLAIATLFFVMVPLKQKKVVRLGQAPAPAG